MPKQHSLAYDEKFVQVQITEAILCAPPLRQAGSGKAAPTTKPTAAETPAASPAESPASVPAGSGACASPSTPPIADEPEEPGTSVRLLQKLRDAGIVHTTLEHAPTRTSEESAAVRGVPLSSGAKALFMKANKPMEHGSPYVLAVMSAARKADLGALKKALGVKNIAMASAQEVWEITRCRPGAVPPFGSLFPSVRTVLDRSLVAQGDRINFNAALRGLSVGMTVKDYLALENPTVLDFTT